jgi:hypothetical protein
LPALRERVHVANTALEVLEFAGDGLAQRVAEEALVQVRGVLQRASVADVMVVDRGGRVIGHGS